MGAPRMGVVRDLRGRRPERGELKGSKKEREGSCKGGELEKRRAGGEGSWKRGEGMKGELEVRVGELEEMGAEREDTWRVIEKSCKGAGGEGS